MTLSLGWGLFGVICSIDLAQLIATYSMPRFGCLVDKLPRSTIRCFNWSFLSKAASKPWNLWMVVTQAVNHAKGYVLQELFGHISVSKKIPYGYKNEINNIHSLLFCATCPIAGFLLVMLSLENLLPHGLANVCVLCHLVLLACLDTLFQQQSLWYDCTAPLPAGYLHFTLPL